MSVTSQSDINTDEEARSRSDSVNSNGSRKRKAKTYVSLTSHPGRAGVNPFPTKWGHPDPAIRGPVCATNRDDGKRNAIGAHGGSYCIYRALAIASNALDPDYVPDFTNTEPAAEIGPFPQWGDPEKIVSVL